MERLLLILLLALAAASCGTPREAAVSLSPDDALTWAVRTLESFEYNVVEVDSADGVVRGIRSANPLAPGAGGAPSVSRGAPVDALWTVTVTVSPVGTGARYRVDGSATPRTTERRRNRIPPSHLDRILVRLADRRR